jgi:hypothetical protein
MAFGSFTCPRRGRRQPDDRYSVMIHGRPGGSTPGSIKGTLVVRSASAPADWPLYEVYAKARYQRGWVEAVIPLADEPLYRQFFTQVAQLCGRSVVA